MKVVFTFSALILASTMGMHAHAARSNPQQAALEGSTFAGLTIAGTVAAGPVGFLLGALGGAFLAEQTRQANNRELALQQINAEHLVLQQALREEQMRTGELEELATEAMTFQVLFATGADTLNDLDLQRVRILADYLQANPELSVILEGHADPRGTDEYNNVLSQERAKSVKHALESMGVEADRIIHAGHGTSFSSAAKGDEEAYRQERRVDITIAKPTQIFSGI